MPAIGPGTSRDGTAGHGNPRRHLGLDVSLLCDCQLWTPEINTLFLHRLWLHGKFLALLTPPDGRYSNYLGLASNWTIMQAQGMLDIALLFPEFKQSPAWEAHALCLGPARLDNRLGGEENPLERA